MPFILGLVALIGAAYFWMNRARNAAAMTQDLAGVAGDVMAAARRLGFRRRYNTHPVESVDDPNLAIAAAGLAFLELSGLPSTEQHDKLLISLQSHLSISHDKAEESLILGRWLVAESGGAQPGLARITRKLYKLNGTASLTPLMAVLQDVATSGRGEITPQQRDALTEISQLYRLK